MKLLPGKFQSKLFLQFLVTISVLLLTDFVIWIVIAGNRVMNAASFWDIFVFAAVLFLSSIIFAALLFLTLSNGSIISLSEILKGKDNFEKGNLDFRIKVTSKDEFEDLANGLNDLAAGLSDANTRLGQDKDIMHADHEQVIKTLQMERDKLNYVKFAEQEKVNYVLSSVTDGIIILSKSRNVILINKVAEELTGYNAPEVTLKSIGKVLKFFEKDREIFPDEYSPLQENASVRGGVYTKQKVRMESPNISPRFVNLTCLITKFSQSDDLGYILVLHNLSQELQVEKMEMDFVTSVINELQQPLQLLTQNFSLLKQENIEQFAGGQNISVSGIQIGIDQLVFFLENLIFMTRIEQHNLELNSVSLDIASVIKQTIMDTNQIAAGRQVHLNFEVPKDPVGQIMGDEMAIRKILLNLLMNSISYTPGGGSVSVSLSQMDNEIFIHVQDTGVGIPSDAMGNLFTKFYRIPTQITNGQAGAGLGLYLCKSLIEMQRGKIWADSVEGKGSTFSFSLPKINN